MIQRCQMLGRTERLGEDRLRVEFEQLCSEVRSVAEAKDAKEPQELFDR